MLLNVIATSALPPVKSFAVVTPAVGATELLLIATVNVALFPG